MTDPVARTWRQIPQELKLPAMSRNGRRRAYASSLKATVVVALIGLLGVGAVAIYKSRPGDPARTPVQTYALRTDGVLDTAWVQKALDIPAGVALGELDLDRLRERLLATGRIESAHLARHFPSTLEIAIAERFPSARIRIADRGDYYVGADGVIFASAGERDTDMFGELPWLAGFKLSVADGGFAPISGMPAVASLLATARNEAPALYRQWNRVDLSRLDSDGEIRVQMKDGPLVTFGRAADYFVQVARLDYTLDHAPAALTIDLSIGASAVMVLDQSAPAPRATSSVQRFNFNRL